MRRRTLLTGSLGLIAFACPLSALAQRDPDGPGGARDGREPADPTRLTQEERRHVPVLVLPEQVRAGRPFDLVVQVGLEPHPMTAAHHVEWIEASLGDGRAFLARLSPSVGYPVVRIPLVAHARSLLVVRARCSLHGTWRTRRALDVR